MHRLINLLAPVFILLLILESATSLSWGQTVDFTLDEVLIVAPRKSARIQEMHGLTLDTLLKSKYYGADLSTLLKRETNINITQYGGQGSLTSIRLRGTSPVHTQINWNGVPINSPTTGSIDLSLVSSNFADALEITYGATGSRFGSGTFGGSLNVVNKPDWHNRLVVSTYVESGSWSHIKGGLDVRTGTERWQYQAAGFAQHSANSYPFRNSFRAGNPIEQRANDTLSTLGFQQNLFIRLGDRWMIHAGSWLQFRNKDLPYAMSSSPRWLSNQKDYSSRLLTRITRKALNGSLEFTLAGLSDSLLYREMPVTVDSMERESGIRTSNLFSSLNCLWFINKSIQIEAGADFERLTAESNSFSGKVAEHRGALFGSFQFGKRNFTGNIDLREAFYSNAGFRPLFSLSGMYRFPGRNIQLKSQISNKFRIPTMNERFWIPGGNPGLIPETGIGYDLATSWKSAVNSRLPVEISVMAFLQNINNWIQWVPTGSYWSPGNVRKVRCQGIESDLSIRKNVGIAHLTLKAMYSYTESLDLSLDQLDNRTDRQLPYVPFHLFQANTTLGIAGFEGAISYRYTGRRYTTDDHDEWLALDPCHLVDAHISYQIPIDRSTIRISLAMLNALNVSYQMIRAYPAPGRSFYLSCMYSFNQTHKQNEKN